MRSLYIFAIVVGCVSVLAFAAIQSSTYSLNFHFIPPLVSGSCTFGSVWNPTNMTCAMCLCLNGRISRCVPQPGCNPFPNATITTTPAPGAASQNVPGQGSAPGSQQSGSPSEPVQGNLTNPQQQQQPPSTQTNPNSNQTQPALNTSTAAPPPRPGVRHSKIGNFLDLS